MTAPCTDELLGWVPVCRYDQLEPERGVAALIGTDQLAIFRLHDGSVHAIDHRDPFSGANVMARGIVGSRGTHATVASPMYKQVFDLMTGQCLDDDTVSVRVFSVSVADDWVHVRVGAGRVQPQARVQVPEGTGQVHG